MCYVEHIRQKQTYNEQTHTHPTPTDTHICYQQTTNHQSTLSLPVGLAPTLPSIQLLLGALHGLLCLGSRHCVFEEVVVGRQLAIHIGDGRLHVQSPIGIHLGH